MSKAEAFASWLPSAIVLILSILALSLAAAPAVAPPARRRRLAAVALVGLLAAAATAWQSYRAADRIARLVRDDRSVELAAQVQSLEDQLAKVKASTRGRSVSADTAAKLADYLRQFGAHQVVVSCVPDDIEAYHYATQIADILKAASWDASGPETTTIFGAVRAMAINVYDDGSRGGDTVKILLDGFVKFGIPYQSRVPPSEALPENQTVELFIGTKPSMPAGAAARPARP
jgi:hypothetical protein